MVIRRQAHSSQQQVMMHAHVSQQPLIGLPAIACYNKFANNIAHAEGHLNACL